MARFENLKIFKMVFKSPFVVGAWVLMLLVVIIDTMRIINIKGIIEDIRDIILSIAIILIILWVILGVRRDSQCPSCKRFWGRKTVLRRKIAEAKLITDYNIDRYFYKCRFCKYSWDKTIKEHPTLIG